MDATSRARRPGVDAHRPARLVVVTGGKGGVGKSNFSLNLGLALCERGQHVLLVDGDSGLGNLDVLLGLCPGRHLGHVLQGQCTAQEAMVRGPLGLHFLPAASGLEGWGPGMQDEVAHLTAEMEGMEDGYDVCLLDAGAGLGPHVRALLEAAGEMVVITTPEPTALADAYATLKTISGAGRPADVWLVVNMAQGLREAEDALRSITAVCRRYLGWVPKPLGWLPQDATVTRAVREQRPFLLAATPGPAARAMRTLAAAFCRAGEGAGAERQTAGGGGQEGAPPNEGVAPQPAGLRHVLLALVQGWSARGKDTTAAKARMRP